MKKSSTLRKMVLCAFLAVFVVLSVPGSALYVHIELSLNRGAYYCRNAADLARESTCPLDLVKVAMLLGDALFVQLVIFGIPLGAMLLVMFALDLIFGGVCGDRVLWTPRRLSARLNDPGGTDTV